MKYRNDLNYEYVRSLLDYYPHIGIFIWKESRGTARKGKLAGFTLHKSTKLYIGIRIDKHDYLAHRLAYLLMTGKMPEGKLDHKDGNGLNNKWNNIRDATDHQNCANSSLRRDNQFGYKGISKNGKKWRARIRVNRQEIFIGNYLTPREAAKAYNEAAIRYFGEFANINEGLDK